MFYCLAGRGSQVNNLRLYVQMPSPRLRGVQQIVQHASKMGCLTAQYVPGLGLNRVLPGSLLKNTLASRWCSSRAVRSARGGVV